MSINGIEAGTWTSPSDFGGVRGRLTPEWWPNEQTQYGVLKCWKITHDGTYIDETKLSDIGLSQVNLRTNPHICMRLEVKENACHVGGLNIFGKRFGNYGQDIVMRTRYEFAEGERPYSLK